MKSILRTAFVFTFVLGLSGTYVIKSLLACGEPGACCEGCGQCASEPGRLAVQTKAEVKGEKAGAVKDPVCGMEVSDIKKAPSEEYKGKVYYFCAEHCKKTFKKDPESYIKEKSQ